MAYLHGVETINVSSGSRTVTEVRTAVIGLIGIAPMGPVNVPTVVSSDTAAAQFGNALPGFNIPKALDAIFAQGAGTVIVINTFDPLQNTANVLAEAHAVVNGKIVLSAAPIGAVTITDAEGDPVTYVKDTDYSLDAYGNFKVLSSAIPDETALKFAFKKLDASTVNAAQIIGTVSANGVRTGIKCFDLSYQLFGYKPKILIAPGYASIAAVAAEMLTAADKFRAIAPLDAPASTTVAQAIAGRGAGTLGGFNTSNERAVLLFPQMKRYDAASDAYEVFPYSASFAGAIAAQDNENGYWTSPSNRELKGVEGAEMTISAGISDANSDANQLNAAGIITVFNTYGSGLRTWGNRSAAYPTNTDPINFLPVLRVRDMLTESIELAMLDFVDRPINNGLIDSIKETVNGFIATLIQRGALLDGACTFDKAKNPNSELANGHITFDISFMPPTPAERITFNAFIDTSLLSAIGS